MHTAHNLYIYIYTSVNPCITCTKQGGAEQKMMPIKDEQGAAFFERPFRAQETNAPHGCGLERHFSSMLLLQGRPRTSRASRGEPSGLERPSRAPQRGRAGSERNRHPRPRPAKRLWVGLACPGRFVFVRLCLVEGAARPRGFERPIRTPQQDRGQRSKVEPSKS